MENLDIFSNPVFISALVSLGTTQFLKSMISIFKSKARSIKDVILTFIWSTGGMPSSHSALATSITTSIGFTNGFTSNIFILSFFFTLVVVRDALGVRRATGMQAKVINNLGKELSEKFGMAFHPVKEVHGHSASEVVVGACLGFFIALAITTL